MMGNGDSLLTTSILKPMLLVYVYIYINAASRELLSWYKAWRLGSPSLLSARSLYPYGLGHTRTCNHFLPLPLP